jgi:Xaa-Pro dipeptidase
MRENEAAAEVNYSMMKLGSAGTSFETNASFGPATAEPHYVPESRKLKKGHLALFDYGAVYQRYVSDITRTFVCSSPSPRQKRMYEVVLEAQLTAIDAIRSGARGKKVDRAAREVIDRSEFKGRFIHGTGHGIGLSVHDPGSISSRRDMVLEEGMVMTVEPGVYVKGEGGVRIEDDVLVTKSGCKILTSASKEFISL